MYRLLCVFLVFYGVNAWTKSCEVLPATPEFVAGEYEIIARYPDSIKTYATKVLIQKSNNGNVLMVDEANKSYKNTWQGRFRPASPGEGCILELEKAPYVMSCLISVDLDNYPRLTCSWGWKDKVTKKPGIAALFHH